MLVVRLVLIVFRWPVGLRERLGLGVAEREDAQMADLGHLVDLEQQGWEALSSGRGGAYYREHLTQDALMVFPFGVMQREDTIEAMESAPPWVSYEMRDPHLITLTPDSGVLLYGVTAQRAGQQPYTATVSSTFVRRDGSWKLAFHQQTPA